MKLSTRTVADDGELVPWLAATGPLAYTPENPPDRDYFFQYGWVMPGILNPRVNPRSHRYFGVWRRDDAEEIFGFWNNARSGSRMRVHEIRGRIADDDIKAPIAVYRHVGHYRRQAGYMLIQHGSYQFVPEKFQPELEAGYVYLYRGLQQATEFRFPEFEDVSATPMAESWAAYLRTQLEVLSDSVQSFNSIHDRAMRTETGGIRDSSRVTDEIAARNGLRFQESAGARMLWTAHQQSFSLDQGIAEWKFGPNHVVVKTPVSNIRILTFFAGESEAKIVDPRKVEIVRCEGCRFTKVAVPAAAGGATQNATQPADFERFA